MHTSLGLYTIYTQLCNILGGGGGESENSVGPEEF